MKLNFELSFSDLVTAQCWIFTATSFRNNSTYTSKLILLISNKAKEDTLSHGYSCSWEGRTKLSHSSALGNTSSCMVNTLPTIELHSSAQATCV